MNVGALLAELAERGVSISVDGDSLLLDAPRGVLTEDDLRTLGERKLDAVRWARLAVGLPVDDRAAALLRLSEVDAADVPVCRCGRLCDVQTMADDWRCGRCDARANERRLRTMRWAATAARWKR